MTLNLKSPKGAAILKQLVAKADTLTENFQPGTLEGWGLGWDALSAVNPRLVMLRVSGYGQTGPYSRKPGFGRIGNAFGGISFLAGEPHGPPVTPGSATLADYMAGLYGAFGVMMALRVRDATGQGQQIDIGLYEPIFRILDELVPAYDTVGYIRQRMGAAAPNVCPHSHYQTGDGRWIAVACTNDKIFARMAALMGCANVAGDGIYGTFAEREKQRTAVDGLVAAWAKKHTQQEAVRLCDEAEVPCGIVAAVDEIFQDPHYIARGNIARVRDPRVGDLAVPNVVPRLAETPGGVDTLGPTLGQHKCRGLRQVPGPDRRGFEHTGRRRGDLRDRVSSCFDRFRTSTKLVPHAVPRPDGAVAMRQVFIALCETWYPDLVESGAIKDAIPLAGGSTGP